MKPLSTTFSEKFFAEYDQKNDYLKIIAEAVQHTGKLIPKYHSIIDMGCATGKLVKEFIGRGIGSIGFEGNPNATPYVIPGIFDSVIIYDLRKYHPEAFTKRFSICTCFRVSGFIPKEDSSVFIKNLIHASDIVILTISPPEEKDVHRVNFEGLDYWELKFKIYGYKRNEVKERRFKSVLKNRKGKTLEFFYQNTFVFEKED